MSKLSDLYYRSAVSAVIAGWNIYIKKAILCAAATGAETVSHNILKYR